jgi:tetratricopeptide (TPR) repeat protein
MLPDDVLIVSGHNRNGTVEDLRAYHEMLIETAAAVRNGLGQGKTAEELQAEKILDSWDVYAGSYVSTDEWIQTLADTMSETTGNSKKRIFEAMYYSLKEGGADAAVALYRELKTEHADEYDFRDTDLLVIGNKLAEHGSAREAVVILELALEEYPKSPYVYYGNYSLALAYQALGHTNKAIDYCELAREQSPDSQAIRDLLGELRTESSQP